jgi:cell division protein FtsW
MSPLAARPERILAIAVLALVSFGLVMVYSASSATALLDDGDPMGFARRQLVYAAIGLAVFVVASRIRPAQLRRLAPAALAVTGAMALLVLVPGIGTVANGARQWARSRCSPRSW